MSRRLDALPATRCGWMELRWGEKTYIMGILNLTPDSFSGDGLAGSAEQALERARALAAEGVDIIDIGAESTRPGATPISAGEELNRVLPVLQRVVAEVIVPVSIDTYKSEVARQAVAAGAALINDVWGLKHDPLLANVAADAGVPLVLMHNQVGSRYGDLMSEVKASLQRSIDAAMDAGVQGGNLIIDPGIGFGKWGRQNLEVLRRLHELRHLGKPILLGTSRKLVSGRGMNLPPADRLEETAASVALGIGLGADIVRVHDVRSMARVARMSDAIVRGRLFSPVTAYLGLGSNLGDRDANISRALGFLSQRVKVERMSSLYDTEPVGFTDQPRFLNAVCQVSTELSPTDLLALAKAIEERLGRQPSPHPNAPRPADVDILLYGDKPYNIPGLIIPHPRLAERAFVLIPLAEIAGDVVEPDTGQTIFRLAATVAGKEGVRQWK
ncbi:MAG: dihydropteroate synthase [Chloroflexi bacterium]|nr:dihydropteroate synthase [Chloroflexota bacterium]